MRPANKVYLQALQNFSFPLLDQKYVPPFQRGISKGVYFPYEYRKFSVLIWVDFSFLESKAGFTKVLYKCVIGHCKRRELNSVLEQTHAFCVLEVCLLLCKWVEEIKEIFIQLN